VTISEKILAFFLSIEASLFQLWLKRFSIGVKADFVHYHSSCGQFFFFKKGSWPGEVSNGGLKYTSSGSTILTVVIEKQVVTEEDELAQKIDAQLSDEPDLGKTVIMSTPVFEKDDAKSGDSQNSLSSLLNNVMDDLPLFRKNEPVHVAEKIAEEAEAIFEVKS
jgi:hypothetical protein